MHLEAGIFYKWGGEAGLCWGHELDGGMDGRPYKDKNEGVVKIQSIICSDVKLLKSHYYYDDDLNKCSYMADVSSTIVKDRVF